MQCGMRNPDIHWNVSWSSLTTSLWFGCSERVVSRNFTLPSIMRRIFAGGFRAGFWSLFQVYPVGFGLLWQGQLFLWPVTWSKQVSSACPLLLLRIVSDGWWWWSVFHPLFPPHLSSTTVWSRKQLCDEYRDSGATASSRFDRYVHLWTWRISIVGLTWVTRILIGPCVQTEELL